MAHRCAQGTPIGTCVFTHLHTRAQRGEGADTPVQRRRDRQTDTRVRTQRILWPRKSLVQAPRTSAPRPSEVPLVRSPGRSVFVGMSRTIRLEK